MKKIYFLLLLCNITKATDIIKENKINLYLNTAEFYMQDGLGKICFLTYKKILEIDPNNIQAKLLLGIEFFKKNQYKEASYNLKKGLELSSDNINSNVLIAKGILKLLEHKHSEAVDYFIKALNKSTNKFNAYFCIGDTLFKLKSYNKARKFFQKALEIYPLEPNAIIKLGSIFFTEKKFKSAIKVYQKIIDLNEFYEKLGIGILYPKVYFYLAKSFYKMGDIKKADLYGEKALKILPNDEEITAFLNQINQELTHLEPYLK